MQVGDLVKGWKSFGDGTGIVTQVVVDDPVKPERNTVLVRWIRRNTLEPLNVRLLEVISESR